MQIFNLFTLEQFPNIFQVNMRAPPEAVRTQIQQLLVDRMVTKKQFCLVVFCPTGLTVNDIEGEEDVSGRAGDCDEFCGSR